MQCKLLLRPMSLEAVDNPYKKLIKNNSLISNIQHNFL